MRIVSLVPSITETLCALGLTEQLVGRTGFCVHPREVMRRIPKVGGTKDVDLAKLRALAPTHVVMNEEENRIEDFDAIRAFVPNVISTFPKAPEDNVALFRDLGAAFDRVAQANALIERFERALAAVRAAAANQAGESVIYLVWRKPWMTVSRDTYISRTLGLVGWETVPAVDTPRYPEIDLESAARSAQRVFLSSEPYRFREADVARVQAIVARPTHLIDGEITSWYGVRAIEGIAKLVAARRACVEESGDRRG